MKISKKRLIQIINEELDDHNSELLKRDMTTAGEIGAGERELQKLKIELEKLKLLLDSEELSLSYRGYSEQDAPDMSNILSQIQNVEDAIEHLEHSIQLDYQDLSQRK